MVRFDQVSEFVGNYVVSESHGQLQQFPVEIRHAILATGPPAELSPVMYSIQRGAVFADYACVSSATCKPCQWSFVVYVLIEDTNRDLR
jgi:hypothetical protein